MTTLKELLDLGGKRRFGVFTSKVSRTMKLADGHTVTTSFDGEVESCDDEIVLPAMAKRPEVSWAAKTDGNRLSQKVAGIVAAARNGHEDSLTKVRSIVAGKPIETPAEEPAVA